MDYGDTQAVSSAGVLTKRDLDAFEQRMNLRFEALQHKFEALQYKMVAAFRGEQLTAAVAAQTDLIRGRTKTLILINLSTGLSAAVLFFGVAKLA